MSSSRSQESKGQAERHVHHYPDKVEVLLQQRLYVDVVLYVMCKIVTPPVLGFSIFLFVIPVGEWKAYLIVPSTLVLMLVWLVHVTRQIWRTTWFKHLLKLPKRLFQGILIPWLLRIKGKLHRSTFGNILMVLAFLNTAGLSHWVYHNVRIREIVEQTIRVMQAYVEYFTSPQLVLHEFEELLRSLRVYQGLNWIRESYVTPVLEASARGETWPLALISIVTLVLALVALVSYIGWYGDDPEGKNGLRQILLDIFGSCTKKSAPTVEAQAAPLGQVAQPSQAYQAPGDPPAQRSRRYVQ